MLTPDTRDLTVRFRESIARDDAVRHEPVDLSGSPLHGAMLFVVGSPRSGTSWLQQMLAVHPRLATGCESHFFCEGLDGLWELDRVRPGTQMGLRSWLTRPEFVVAVRGMADAIFLPSLEATPGTSHVLEKTPHHEPAAAERMAELYPDATYVHIVRDGYASASSMRDLWPDSEHGKSFKAAATMWRIGVESVRTHLSAGRYIELRYEDAVQDPGTHLRAIFDLANLGYNDELIETALSVGKKPVNVRPGDTRAGVEKWKSLGRKATREIEKAAGPLLKELGYLRR